VLTGIPQLVEMPAPVTTTIFFAATSVLAMFCNWRLLSFLTSRMAMIRINEESMHAMVLWSFHKNMIPKAQLRGSVLEFSFTIE